MTRDTLNMPGGAVVLQVEQKRSSAPPLHLLYRSGAGGAAEQHGLIKKSWRRAWRGERDHGPIGNPPRRRRDHTGAKATPTWPRAWQHGKRGAPGAPSVWSADHIMGP
jgi:hypothetical protein